MDRVFGRHEKYWLNALSAEFDINDESIVAHNGELMERDGVHIFRSKMDNYLDTDHDRCIEFSASVLIRPGRSYQVAMSSRCDIVLLSWSFWQPGEFENHDEFSEPEFCNPLYGCGRTHGQGPYAPPEQKLPEKYVGDFVVGSMTLFPSFLAGEDDLPDWSRLKGLDTVLS